MILVADGAVTLASGTDVKRSSLQFGVNDQNDTLGGSLNIDPGTSLTVQDSVIVGNSAGGGFLETEKGPSRILREGIIEPFSGGRRFRDAGRPKPISFP